MMRRLQSKTGSLWAQMVDAEQHERQERLHRVMILRPRSDGGSRSSTASNDDQPSTHMTHIFDWLTLTREFTDRFGLSGEAIVDYLNPVIDRYVSHQQQRAILCGSPRHLTSWACHCAARLDIFRPRSREGYTCVVLRMGVLRLFDGKVDIVDLVLRYYHGGASGWDTAGFEAPILSINMGPLAT